MSFEPRQFNHLLLLLLTETPFSPGLGQACGLIWYSDETWAKASSWTGCLGQSSMLPMFP